MDGEECLDMRKNVLAKFIFLPCLPLVAIWFCQLAEVAKLALLYTSWSDPSVEDRTNHITITCRYYHQDAIWAMNERERICRYAEKESAVARAHLHIPRYLFPIHDLCKRTVNVSNKTQKHQHEASSGY